MFEELKLNARGELERKEVSVDILVDKITSLPANIREPHREFLRKYNEAFQECSSIRGVFGHLNTHWDYLNYDILEYIITEFSLNSLDEQLQRFKEHRDQFLDDTSLEQFNEVERDERHMKAPKGFKEWAIDFKLSRSTSLRIIEIFRKRFAYQYGLRECAIILSHVKLTSVIIILLVPESVMVKSTDTEFFHEHNIVCVKQNGIIIYQQASICMGIILA